MNWNEKNEYITCFCFGLLVMFLILILLILNGCGICRNRVCINTCDKTSICYSQKVEDELMECKKDNIFCVIDLEEQAIKIGNIKEEKNKLEKKYKKLVGIKKNIETKVNRYEEQLKKLEIQNKIINNKYIAFKQAHKEYYVIDKNESLSSIAGEKKIYNDVRQWPLLLWANSNLIKNYKLIYPGTKLLIKRDWTKNEINKAIILHEDLYPSEDR